MDLDEVDAALDMRIIYSLTGDLPVAEFTKRLSINLQSGLHFGDESLEISFFIPEELATNREISIFLAQSNATKQGNVYFSNFGMSTDDLHNGLKEAFDIARTTVLDNMVLSKGTYFISCRFHSSDLKKITSNVLKFSRKMDGLSVKYLGPNPGMRSILEDIKTITNLKEVQWQAKVPKEALKNSPFAILPDQWVLESRYMTTGKGISEIVRTKEKIRSPEKNSIVELVPELNLYEFRFGLEDPFLKKFFSFLYDTRIIRFCRIFAYDNGVMTIYSLLPEVLLDNYMESMATLTDQFPEWEVSMTKILDF